MISVYNCRRLPNGAAVICAHEQRDCFGVYITNEHTKVSSQIAWFEDDEAAITFAERLENRDPATPEVLQ